MGGERARTPPFIFVFRRRDAASQSHCRKRLHFWAVFTFAAAASLLDKLPSLRLFFFLSARTAEQPNTTLDGGRAKEAGCVYIKIINQIEKNTAAYNMAFNDFINTLYVILSLSRGLTLCVCVSCVLPWVPVDWVRERVDPHCSVTSSISHRLMTDIRTHCSRYTLMYVGP